MGNVLDMFQFADSFNIQQLRAYCLFVIQKEANVLSMTGNLEILFDVEGQLLRLPPALREEALKYKNPIKNTTPFSKLPGIKIQRLFHNITYAYAMQCQ